MPSSAIPTRHPDSPQPIPLSIRAFAALLGIKQPSPEQWRELGEDLLVGDEPMDRLLDWMHSAGSTELRPLFERALRDGIATVPEAPEPLREFFVQIETIPDWVDPVLLRRGVRTIRIVGVDGISFARDVALLAGYLASGFNQTLLRSGALEKASSARFAETLQWALDVSGDDAMKPFGQGYRSTVKVRLIHAYVRRHVAAMPDWRNDEWGLPINQTDMAATLVGALMTPVIGSLAMGLVLSPADLDAAAHLTRYVGWLLGVQDRWLPKNFRDSVRILSHTLGAIFNPDETTRQLAVPMADDPLTWHYRNLPGLRARLERAKHLSLTAAFVGPGFMRDLGLPARTLPLYPLLRIPVNLARSITAALLPGGMDRAAVHRRRAQEAFLRMMTGGDEAAIGHSATTTAHAA